MMASVGDSCWRRQGVAALELPFRVRLPDGSTRTDPSQWGNDKAVLAATGWSRSTLTQDDLDALFPPPPTPPEPTPYEAGFDTGLGWRLGWQPDDVALLTGMYVLASRAAELGVDQPVNVVDMAGVAHAMTFAEYEQIMLAYGAARAALSAPPAPEPEPEPAPEPAPEPTPET
jgi:hypothetical protein